MQKRLIRSTKIGKEREKKRERSDIRKTKTVRQFSETFNEIARTFHVCGLNLPSDSNRRGRSRERTRSGRGRGRKGK